MVWPQCGGYYRDFVTAAKNNAIWCQKPCYKQPWGQQQQFFWGKHCFFLPHIILLGHLHVLWQVSFGCWVTWSISSWYKYYESVFFPKAEWWVTKLLFLSLNNWGLKFLQNECSQSSRIYLSPEKLRKMFTFQSCKFVNDKIGQNINFAKLPSGITVNFIFQEQLWERRNSYNTFVSLG